ncbi:S4 domain-containing protein YaaA [Streptococcus catagoni]|uniref:S4 domain-containing protein YaaA n=1 Tax=Streptococcus catagoni TaxID=2654874 RepID=UPI00140A6998|nr:S4 domain-containing protein YaaA [Streptococcus catagoni]
MDYKLFTEYITLQALLKEVGLIQSGGAVKAYLAEQTILFNGEDEKRRGKKIRIGDTVSIPDQGLTITIVKPSQEELVLFQEQTDEKARVAKLVKKLNKDKKEELKKGKNSVKRDKNKPVRFPGA